MKYLKLSILIGTFIICSSSVCAQNYQPPATPVMYPTSWAPAQPMPAPFMPLVWPQAPVLVPMQAPAPCVPAGYRGPIGPYGYR